MYPLSLSVPFLPSWRLYTSLFFGFESSSHAHPLCLCGTVPLIFYFYSTLSSEIFLSLSAPSKFIFCAWIFVILLYPFNARSAKPTFAFLLHWLPPYWRQRLTGASLHCFHLHISLTWSSLSGVNDTGQAPDQKHSVIPLLGAPVCGRASQLRACNATLNMHIAIVNRQMPCHSP